MNIVVMAGLDPAIHAVGQMYALTCITTLGRQPLSVLHPSPRGTACMAGSGPAMTALCEDFI